MLAALARPELRAQETEPVTQVAPVASPSPAAEASPAAAVSPAASPSGSDAILDRTGAATPPPPQPAPGATASTPGKTAPVTSGISPPTVSGSAASSATATAAVASPPPRPPSPYSIEIDLEEQRAYLLKNGRKFAESPISSGRQGHETPTGNFEVIEKDLNHFSSLYGKIVEKDSGRVVKSGADAAMPVPKGCEFVPAPMKWFMRFDGATGLHAGILPGYAASHGCVRMPASKAKMFYEAVEVGTPVHVFGTAPVRESREESAPRRVAVLTPRPASTPKPRHGWWF